ncbi:MAG: hypothetical protein WA996_24750, partial [Candidatus Promineifilaceae bacterium]
SIRGSVLGYSNRRTPRSPVPDPREVERFQLDDILHRAMAAFNLALGHWAVRRTRYMGELVLLQVFGQSMGHKQDGDG